MMVLLLPRLLPGLMLIVKQFTTESKNMAFQRDSIRKLVKIFFIQWFVKNFWSIPILVITILILTMQIT